MYQQLMSIIIII